MTSLGTCITKGFSYLGTFILAVLFAHNPFLYSSIPMHVCLLILRIFDGSTKWLLLKDVFPKSPCRKQPPYTLSLVLPLSKIFVLYIYLCIYYSSYSYNIHQGSRKFLLSYSQVYVQLLRHLK